MVSVSVVIPARDSQETIRFTVESLWNQTFCPNEVIIVVGSNDFTRLAIEDFIENGFVKMIIADPPCEFIRDAMWRRRVGVEAAKGDVIVFIDSKSIAEKHAFENVLNMMTVYNASAVAGITPAWPDQQSNFWASIHDKALVSNLPKFPKIGWVTKDNFGMSESLPVTSAFAITKDVYNLVSDDFAVEFSKYGASYEDYVLSWFIAEKGVQILITNQFIAFHKHRLSWKEYSTQIGRSGQGAAMMAKMYPACPFGTRRIRQVSMITLAFLLGVVIGIVAITVYGPMAIGAGLLLSMFGYLVLGTTNVVKAKEIKAFIFPLFTTLLIINFALHFTKTYIKTGHRPQEQEMASYLQIH